ESIGASTDMFDPAGKLDCACTMHTIITQRVNWCIKFLIGIARFGPLICRVFSTLQPSLRVEKSLCPTWILSYRIGEQLVGDVGDDLRIVRQVVNAKRHARAKFLKGFLSADQSMTFRTLDVGFKEIDAAQTKLVDDVINTQDGNRDLPLIIEPGHQPG